MQIAGENLQMVFNICIIFRLSCNNNNFYWGRKLRLQTNGQTDKGRKDRQTGKVNLLTSRLRWYKNIQLKIDFLRDIKTIFFEFIYHRIWFNLSIYNHV